MTDLVHCHDGVLRPAWAATSALLEEYYDTEWGMPVRDEVGVFERICLEGFQSGLSWATVLRKRPAFREAFASFDPDVVATFTEADIARLMTNHGIIRNRGKIVATIAGAHATIALRAEGGLANLVWSFQPATNIYPKTMADIATSSPESVALAQALKQRGFRFIGPVTIFALMQAIGMVDGHLVADPRRGSSGVWPD
ncbi:MAG: DNA-3-methyladenine glycosylase I [Propionibacteriaceae bacterium]